VYGSRLDLSHLTEDWPVKLEKLLESEGNGLLDAVIDSAGRDIAEKISKLLKSGGKVVAYGM
jgi:NADPH:quinone reductase-like Zn-dependent oxidoreductase